MINVVGYFEHCGRVQYHGGYHCLLFEYLHGTEHRPQYS